MIDLEFLRAQLADLIKQRDELTARCNQVEGAIAMLEFLIHKAEPPPDKQE